MKDNKFDKVLIAILICLCAYFFISKIKKRDESCYHIDPKPYEICNKKIYVTDFADSNGLDIQALFNEIEYNCKN